jgi:hypothetical protein
MQSHFVMLAMVGLCACSSSTDGGSAGGDVNGGGTGGGGSTCTPVAIPWLAEGNFWKVAWGEIEIDIGWSGGRGDYDAGDYIMKLGAPYSVGDKTMFPLVFDGNTTKYAPLWRAIGTDGCGGIFGQRSAEGTPTLVYSTFGTDWSGTGFYTDFGGATRAITINRNASMVSSQYTSLEPMFEPPLTAVGYSTSDRIGEGTGCEYFPGYGTVCGSDDPGSLKTEAHLEYWDDGAGPIGMHISYDYEDCLGSYCNGRHVERRVEVRHFGDVSSFPSAYEDEPDTYADPNDLPVTVDQLFVMFASVNEWDTPSGTLPGYDPPEPAAEIHDWYRFEVGSDMLDPLTFEFYMHWNDEADLELHLFTAPDHPDYGFMHLAEGFDDEWEEFAHTKTLSGTYNVPGPYLVGVVRRSDPGFATPYGIMSYAAYP